MKVKDTECVTGCIHYSGNEVRHHKDCPFYPESLTKIYDDLLIKYNKKYNKNKKLLKSFFKYINKNDDLGFTKKGIKFYVDQFIEEIVNKNK